MKRRLLLSFLIMISLALVLKAQDSTSHAAEPGKYQELEKTSIILDRADSLILADSLEKERLTRQIEELRSTDKRRVTELRARLDSMKMASEQREARIRKQVDSLRVHVTGVPVVFNGDTLFRIYSKLGPYKPSERAASIQAKINRLADTYSYSADSLHVEHGEESSDLFYGGIILLSVTDRDALWLEKRRQDVALDYKDLIVESIKKYHDENNLMKNFFRILLTMLIVLILYYLVRKMNKWFTRFVLYISRKSFHYLKGLKIKEYEVLTVERQSLALQWLMNVVKWIVILLILYLSVPLIFSIFPATEDVARTMIGYVTRPLVRIFWAAIGFIPELVTIAIIIAITHYFVRLLRFLRQEIEAEALKIPGFYPDWARPTFGLLRIISYTFAFIVIFPYLPGSDSAVFQGVSVFLGLLISLGSSSAVSNIIAGLVITYMRPFKIGDRVKIGEVTGDVIEKTMLVTRVRTIKNEDITIPNSAILNGFTINYTSLSIERGLILNTTVTIGYDVHWPKVQACLLKAAEATDHILKEPKPFVLQTALDDFYVHYELNAYTNDAGLSARIYSDLHANILDAFHNADIEIMSPHYRANRDGGQSTIPK